ncbi:hypothetical protein [Deinococcus sp. KSM4-11]|uniref:hypothetical protein n=1 Tax=Deinococcus sp. KSM4-11 TaxID=2568654 RepID=UPI001F112150|nr:hypothetical protein [Deinococcus sp. KSM4-11]
MTQEASAPGGTVYLLEQGGVALGRMPLRRVESFAMYCDFHPTPAFDAYWALFDEDAAIAERLAHDDSSELLSTAEATLERILALGLVIRREGGGVHRDVLIGIEGHTAHFRALSPEEEFL